MSGVEVVGLVLGALPLLLKSIEAYSDTLSIAQRILCPRRELRKIRSRVSIALQVFRNTAKLLLLRIVEAKEAAELLKDPESQRWQDIDFDRKLKELLGDSYSAWRAVMFDISTDVEDIKKGLNVSFEEAADRINTTQRLKLGFSKGRIDDAMKRIDSSNRHFERLTDQAVSLAAILAHHRSTLPDFRRMRAAASQSFSIMDSGLQCQCKSRHVLCLGLERANSGHESGHAKTQEKHRIVLASQSRPGQPARLECVADVEISVPVEQPDRQAKHGLQPWTGDRSCLGFLADSGIVTDSASILPSSSMPVTLRHNLVSIQTLLPSTARQKGKLRARGRRYTALMASWALLRLYSTPWLEDGLFQNEISFIRSEDGSLVDLPFVSKQLEPAINLAVKSRKADAASLVCIRNAWVYALGIFLIELCLGQTIAELREPQDEISGGQLPFLTEYQTAVRSIDEVEDQAGLRYSTAVRRCVRCDFDERVYDLDNARFCQAIYKGVITLLEEDVRQLDGIEKDRQFGQYMCFS